MGSKAARRFNYEFISFFVALTLATIFFSLDAEARGGGHGSSVFVHGYTKSNGTYVAPHYRSAPDGSFENNWSTKGNINPYTGEVGTKVTPPAKAGDTNAPLGNKLSDFSTSNTLNEYRSDSEKVSPLINRSSVPRSDFYAAQKQRDHERAKYWAERGYNFDSSYMSAYSMDQKVKDIERAKYWAERGYNFDSSYMSAYSMDQKVKDIERAKYWTERGYNFDSSYMSAYSMDQKVKDIERAKYWAERGYNFDSSYMSAYSMDQKVKDIERAKYWKERGYNFNPNYMSAYSMDSEARRAQGAR